MKRMLLMAVAITLSIPTLANAQRSYDISRVVFWSSVAADHLSTEMLFARYPGQVVELNPIAGQNVYRRTAVGIGVAAGVDYATSWLRRNGHRKWAIALNFALSGVHFGAAAHNLRQLK